MFKHRLPPRIVFLLRLVNWAIYFNNKTWLTGVEIDDETVNAVLATKFDAQLPMAQTLPKRIFSKSGILAQLARGGQCIAIPQPEFATDIVAGWKEYGDRISRRYR